jgi:hypothetical protein
MAAPAPPLRQIKKLLAGTRDESYGWATTPRFSFTAPRECVLDWCIAKLSPEMGSKTPAAIAKMWTLIVILQPSRLEEHYCLRWSKSAADKPSDYLSANQRHMGFDNSANPNVEYLAAVQAIFDFCHRRVFRNTLTLTGTRISPCATSNRPIQMMSGK